MATKSVVLSEAVGAQSYKEYVNPQWVAVLNLLDMNVEYERCEGCELFTKDGRRILDYLSGYCVHNTGHNHPYVVEALKQELDKLGPAMLQSHVPAIAGELAERLRELAGGGLKKVYFWQQRGRGGRGGHRICARDNGALHAAFWTEALGLAKRAANI